MLDYESPPPLNMNRTLIFCFGLPSLLWTTTLFSQQPGPAANAGHSPQSVPQSGPQYSAQGTAVTPSPVSYASMTQLNGVLSQLEEASKNAQADLAKLRIDRWKTDGSYKKQSLANVDSIQRNLQGAMPEMIGQLRSAPESLPATFKLYRNLDALYDVLGSVAESTGAFGSKEDYQTLSNDLNTIEGARRSLAERLENLATSKEAEIMRLRTDLKTAQAAIPATPPKIKVVDDTQPAKPVRKKTPAKKPVVTPTAPGQQTQPPAKPQ
jgi:hypothetical protein